MNLARSIDKKVSVQSEPNTQTNEFPGCDPLIKWAGGKRRLSKQICTELNVSNCRYFEPFFGGGAIFFRLQPASARLSDINPELIECYQQLRDNPRSLALRIASMHNSEGEYYRVRASTPRSPLGRAARFIYLTSLSFNGIYRQNLKGEFNVPYGQKTAKVLPSLAQIERISLTLQDAELVCCDFESATADAEKGDTVYFDPPYTVAHNNNGFVKYNASMFSWDDQKRLASQAKMLSRRGCKVVISNADHDSLRQLYPTFDVKVIRRLSVIAAASQYRIPVTECLFISKS